MAEVRSGVQPYTGGVEPLVAHLREVVASKRGKTGFDSECEHSEADALMLLILRACGQNEAANLYEEWRQIVGFWYA